MSDPRHLPPDSRRGLVRETVLLLAGCVVFVVLLGVVVYLWTPSG